MSTLSVKCKLKICLPAQGDDEKQLQLQPREVLTYVYMLGQLVKLKKKVPFQH